MGGVVVRSYLAKDARNTLDVFLDAIVVTAAQDYSPEQVNAWAAPHERTIDEWHAARARAATRIAMIGAAVAGFADIDSQGHIDMMFVHSRFARRGVATALLGDLETYARGASIRRLTTDASITARPFFERYGFVVVAEQHPVRRGVQLSNYRMSKSL